jgi:superfamily II DNA or RNA helicase
VGDEGLITVSNVITIDNPSVELMEWCKQNLKLPNPEYATKLRMHFYLGKTPQYLYLYETRGDKLVLPYGVLRNILPMVNREEVKTEFPVAEKIDYGCEVPLYDYQEKAVEEVYWKQYGILQSAAGSGKTQMGIALIAKLGKRALWLTHTKDLLTQSKQRAEQYMDPALLGTITEGKVNIGSGITFATVQTMCNLDLAQYKNHWDVIIVDECHRVAGTPTAVSQFSKVLNSLAARHKYGLSATVHRSDG